MTFNQLNLPLGLQETLRQAVRDRRITIVGRTSAYLEAQGPEWAKEEVARCDALIARLALRSAERVAPVILHEDEQIAVTQAQARALLDSGVIVSQASDAPDTYRLGAFKGRDSTLDDVRGCLWLSALVTKQYMDLVFTLRDAWPIVHGTKDASLMKSWTVLLRETGDFAAEPPVISVALNTRLYAALEAGGPLIARSLCRRSLRERVERVLTIHEDLRQPPAAAVAARPVETAPATPAANPAVPASVAALQKETLEAIDALFKGGDFHELVQASGLDTRLTAAVVKCDRAGAGPDGLAKALEAFNRIAAGEEEAMILDTRLREVRVGLNQAISARMGVDELMMGVLDRLADGDDYNDVVEETGIKARVAEAIAERSIQKGQFIVVRELDADGERWVTSHDSEANADNFRSDVAQDGYRTSPFVEVPVELAAVGEPLMTFLGKLVAATTRFEYPANSQQIEDRGAERNEVPRG